jgi:hypothetical protein
MTDECDARTGNGMSMADDNTLRSFRANDPYRRDPAPASERDRGTGSDPLAELARLIGQSDPFAEVGRSSSRAGDGREETAATPPAAPDWRGSPPPYHVLRNQDAPLAPQFEPDGHQPSAAYHDVDEHGYARETQYGDPDHLAHHQDDAAYAAPAHEHEQDGAYYDDGKPTAPQEEIYDDPPHAGRRRSGMLTALTLIGCAMLGTAGAYGYRTYYAGPVTSSAAPVIVADKTPTKVVPASEAQSGKVIQDRVGDQGPGERVVTREEQPVELKPPPQPVAPPPVIATVPSFPPTPPPAAAPPPAPPSSAASNEPKRVRTVTIRADGSDPSGRPVAVTSSTAPRPAPAPKAPRGAPLSLDPQELAEAPSAPPARSAPLTPPAPRVASAPATGGTGGYVVQLSSQRTEAEAQASYRAMQAKYPGALSNRSPIIKRADLGAKGVFYRALVGPFASSADAGHFCSSLKAAGGQCIIQKN